jgi:hypothetical protein
MRDYEKQAADLRLCAESDDPVDECCWEECTAHQGDRSPMCRQKTMLDAADAIEELLRWRGHSFLRWEKENYKTPPTEVFHDRYYDAMQVVHAICNANPPEGVSQETFRECLAAVFREIEELPAIKFPPKEAANESN